MTRFHVIAIVALVLATAGLLMNNVLLVVATVLALGIATGLGVAFPHLSLFGPFICRGSTARRCVALTFDDGPDARSTPALLDLLRDAKVLAAFFCVGERVTANTELAARIVREGHLLENHSYAHHNTTNFFTVARLREELEMAQAAIAKATGVAPTMFRPPMGLSNPRVFRAAKLVNLRVIGWTVRSLDTMTDEAETIVARIKRRLEPGAIILLHDGNIPPERLLPTVKSLLDTLRTLGYEVVKLDELLKEA
ncbi:MAG: polysaccharide deacetylase family protein [Verrucomicrobia bacterium]|nr:polysaccharide deacetylase family protein [Verrucomicrobiota bacterium]